MQNVQRDDVKMIMCPICKCLNLRKDFVATSLPLTVRLHKGYFKVKAGTKICPNCAIKYLPRNGDHEHETD